MTHNQRILRVVQKKSIINLMDPFKANFVVEKLRAFCKSKGMIEDFPQHRQMVLSACEQPDNVMLYIHQGLPWPLPQTGQMWLEYMLLAYPEVNGFFCSTTSYRDEQHPQKSRHDFIFQMFEFEIRGTINDLRKFEEELLDYLGFDKFKKDGQYPRMSYKDALSRFGLKKGEEITSDHEENLIYHEFGPVFFLEYFPEHSHPFWNMKREDEVAKKIDVILAGMETIGSAERSCDPNEMRDRFYKINHGEYAASLFKNFGKKRVKDELKLFLSLKFFKRAGAGIGLNRLIRSMEACGLLPNF